MQSNGFVRAPKIGGSGIGISIVVKGQRQNSCNVSS